MRKIQEIVVKLSYFGFTRTCGEVVVSECHVIPSPVNLIGCPVKCLGTANLVVKLSVTRRVHVTFPYFGHDPGHIPTLGCFIAFIAFLIQLI